MQNLRRKNESGRSMVEMLGVLAIIGVLSVGGISAYGVAMKKHKANELLHRASMLASTVSAQIMSGKDPTELDTFADSNLGKFTLDYDSTKTTFDLKISELDGSVCSQLKKGGMVQKVECNETAKTASITYYKNLATTEAEGEKSPTEESGVGGDTPLTTCPTGTSVDGEGGLAITVDDTSCYCNEKDTVYKEGSCTQKTEGCFSYRDCNKGEYCHLTGDSGCEELKDQEPGKCIPLSQCDYVVTYGDFWFGWCYDDSDPRYDEPLGPDWWTAKDVCEVQGMRMARLSDFNCDPIVENSNRPYCDPDKLSTQLWLSLGTAVENASVWFEDKDEYKSGCYYFYTYLEEGAKLFSSSRGSYRNSVLCHK
jgi:type II secretory pathway pseudopilin PulG